jgi:hypothetical protein
MRLKIMMLLLKAGLPTHDDDVFYADPFHADIESNGAEDPHIFTMLPYMTTPLQE